MGKSSAMMETGRFVTLRNLTQNHFLAALPQSELDQIAPHLQLVALPLGHTICEVGEPLHHAWFPTSAVVSLGLANEAGEYSEIAAVGNEGVVGLPLFMGLRTASNRAVVHSPGYAFRLDAQWLQEPFVTGPAITRLLLRYSEALFTQTALAWACNRHHRVEQQLSRWLLLSIDRLDSNELVATHELVANALGVDRERLQEAADTLTNAQLIDIDAGQIRIHDRPGLEQRACGCYAATKRVFERLLPRETEVDHS
jgi:CRP-like cAMP-binding protein